MKTHTAEKFINCKHEDYLLFIKWKWILIKVFILTAFTLSRLRRRRKGGLVLLSRVQRQKRWEGRQERQAHSVWLSVWKCIIISVWLFYFFSL